MLALPAGDALAARGVPEREADPIVLTGKDVPNLAGAPTDGIVAFRWTGRRWRGIPVQVDERALVDFQAVRRLSGSRAYNRLAYTDAGTFAGADPDPTFDDDDEIVAMAKDAGERAAVKDPAPRGVRGRSRTAIRVSDPLRHHVRAFVYLFRSKGQLDPAAGRSYVEYRFHLDSGDYMSTYDFDGVANNGNGPPANTESSTVTTPYYSQHLLSRWIEDELHITAGDASGIDILDGDKAQVAYGCGRSELTFSRGGGGYIANVSGPVRAIRSYIGANSGTYTQRDHIYYELADVARTFLRVHPGISVISQFYDYSPAAIGMAYRNSLNPDGVTIDGVPDSMTPGEVSWEQVSGEQGSAAIVSRVDTDLAGFMPSSYYLDDSTSPPVQQCGGYADSLALGASGTLASSEGGNTDPTLGPAAYLTASRTTFYGAPGEGAKVARLRSRQVDAPLRVRVQR